MANKRNRQRRNKKPNNWKVIARTRFITAQNTFLRKAEEENSEFENDGFEYTEDNVSGLQDDEVRHLI